MKRSPVHSLEKIVPIQLFRQPHTTKCCLYVGQPPCYTRCCCVFDGGSISNVGSLQKHCRGRSEVTQKCCLFWILAFLVHFQKHTMLLDEFWLPHCLLVLVVSTSAVASRIESLLSGCDRNSEHGFFELGWSLTSGHKSRKVRMVV